MHLPESQNQCMRLESIWWIDLVVVLNCVVRSLTQSVTDNCACNQVHALKEKNVTVAFHFWVLKTYMYLTEFFLFTRQTGQPYHNFISWQDMRSHNFVESWNKSLALKVCTFVFSPSLLLFLFSMNFILSSVTTIWFVHILNSGSSSQDSIPGQEHCIVFLGKTLNFHGEPLHLQRTQKYS